MSKSRQATYYRKVGRKYEPVSEYDSEVCDAFPKGTHMVQSYPGGTLRRFNIDPKYAPMIAAGRIAEETISDQLRKAGEIRMQRGAVPLTVAQKAAWDKLVEEFGEDARQLEWPSVREVAEAGVNAMVKEAQELMDHPMVQQAYEEFEATCRLVYGNKKL
jgi:hypothetical protein